MLGAAEEARLTIERNIEVDGNSGTDDGLIVKTSVPATDSGTCASSVRRSFRHVTRS
jgi:hypothetical protein